MAGGRGPREHIQPLIAFYHSDRTPKKMPSVATYTKDVKLFLKRLPPGALLQPWNEVNRGYVNEHGSGSYASPSASQSAQYYLALRKACSKCTIVGLDVLDSTDVRSTINYIKEFKRDVGAPPRPRSGGCTTTRTPTASTRPARRRCWPTPPGRCG